MNKRIENLIRSRTPGFIAAMIIAFIFMMGPANAETVVAPRAYATTPGEGATGIFSGEGSRSLNIYDASEFNSVMPDGGIITSVAFRLDESQITALSIHLEATEIRMSTSPLPPSTLSDKFSDYIGPDETIVFPAGSIDALAGGSPMVPHPFEVVIPFTTPFYYHPRHGSLSLDVRNIVGGSPGLFDTGGGALSLAAGLPDPVARHFFGGAIVEFQFTAVPEPASWKVGSVGSVLILFMNLKRKSS